MIRSKQDYKFYLEADFISLGKMRNLNLRDRIYSMVFKDKVWEFQKQLRKAEYLKNCHHSLIGKIRYAFAYVRLHRLSIPLGFIIHPNSFGPGLSIAHPGPILVGASVRIGANCRLHQATTITSPGPDGKSPRLGDNIYIGARCPDIW
jgi:serine O-acetyltransferase